MKKLIFLFTLVALIGVSNTQAQDCKNFLRDLFDYAAKPGNAIDFKLVALDKGFKWGQYTEGELRYFKKTTNGPLNQVTVTSEGLTGSAKQYFSDRTAKCKNGQLDITYWFNKFKPDDLGLDIEVKYNQLVTTQPCPNPVTMTLKSWGNAKYTFCPVCSDGFMYLLTNGTVIVFKKGKASNPGGIN